MKKLELGMQVIKKIKSLGYEAYIVGGAVRDYLLGLDATDIDITTSAGLEIIAQNFTVILDFGLCYDSLKISYFEEVFEITAYRKEICYQDHRHPIVERCYTLEEDLKRRDFTINALAMADDYQIVDHFAGLNDLNNRLIKTIGLAKKRFEEDSLRVLRAVYFAGKLNFSLDEQIISAFQYDYVKYLKVETLKEMFKQLVTKAFLGLRYVVDYRLFRSFSEFEQLAFDCLQYQVWQNYYALFELLHGYLPIEEFRLTKEERKTVKNIVFLIKSKFSDYSLYKTDLNYLAEAVVLANQLGGNYNEEDLRFKALNLPIKGTKDIDFDFNRLSPSLRGHYIDEVTKAILAGNLANEALAIADFIENGE